jgi:hypothetical protein
MLIDITLLKFLIYTRSGDSLDFAPGVGHKMVYGSYSGALTKANAIRRGLI